eukprot:CAMPEP_0114606058 /NCGR_PEP_ID=MMETSP0168-20121206/1369_1 /TAXON_ID=95228 ORGANISM="Vannella sp., Strain DIVA3 517/6/12" /NCGR_SAMPLE_ID=MMETSP0168 /ASSEMBLY_ACC=CAM_ASM_000044 /LENGTH=1173 /DNA_ID=CAMNT_0001816917 /DNA_START=278 /DNA_END=3796 /DNA_ORIENTATION=-
MTQMVAFCHKAQKAAASRKDVGNFVSSMNGFVVACIALTKSLIKIAKEAMAKKTALDPKTIEEANTLLADLRENCSKIAKCAGEVSARSPRQSRRGSSASLRGQPTAVPEATDEHNRVLVAAIKDVMTKKELLGAAINTRDAVEFVSKAKELVTSVSALKKATLRHPSISGRFSVDRLSTVITGYVKAAKSFFQAPTDGNLHKTYEAAGMQMTELLKDMVTGARVARSPRGARLSTSNSTSSVRVEEKKTVRRATIVGAGDSSAPNFHPELKAATKMPSLGDIAATPAAVESSAAPAKNEAEETDIAAVMEAQLEEEEKRVEAEIKAKAEAEAEKARLVKEEKERKEKEEEEARKEAERKATEARQAEEAAIAAAEAAAVAEFEEAAKTNVVPKSAPPKRLGVELPPGAVLKSERSESDIAVDNLLESMIGDKGGEWLATTVKKKEEKKADIIIGTEPVRQRGFTVATSADAEVAVAALEAAEKEKAGSSPPAEDSKILEEEEEAPEVELPAGMPVMKKNVSGKVETGADVAVNLLMDLYPQFKEVFTKSTRAPAVKHLINDSLLLNDTLRRNVILAGRGSSECSKVAKAMTGLAVAVHCYINGVEASDCGMDRRRAAALTEAGAALYRTLLVVLDTLGDHSSDTVPQQFHRQSLDHVNNTVVDAMEKEDIVPDEHVLSACRVHTVGLIESQLRERIYDQTKGLHGMAVHFLHTMRIVFSGAMVEFNAWVELCASCTALVAMAEEALGSTHTLVEVLRLKKDNFASVTCAEELDVEDLVNINIWTEADSPAKSKGSKVKLGTLNQLVSYLTSDEKIDNAFLRTFVCTYRSFSTPVQLLEKLQERFAVPDTLAAREKAIQLRVCVTLKYWVQNQFPDFDDSLIIRLFTFLNHVEDAGHSAMADGIRQQLKEKMEERASQVYSRGNLLPRPLELSARPTLVSDYIEQYAPLDVAKQLTLIDFSIFSLIRPAELMNQAWTSKKLSHRALHVCTFMNRVNTLSNWAATLILSRPNLAARIKTMQFLVEVAHQLRAMNNYHSLMGIVAGTNVSAISRLKHTKDGLGKDAIKKMTALEQLMHPSGSFKHYRKHLSSSKYPIIPYLGVYLTDLVFIEDGNPDEVDGFINFEKRDLAFAPVQAVQTCQGEGYPYPKCEPLYSTLCHLCQLDDELLWALSQT